MKLAAVALANLEELCSKEKVAILHESRGGESSWDGVQMQFLWPHPGADESAAAPKNDDSLVMRLKYGERAFLLPGDAERQAERTMVHQAAAGALRADVLKVGHHGSKHSTTPDFLAAVTPSVAVSAPAKRIRMGTPMPSCWNGLRLRGYGSCGPTTMGPFRS